MTKILLCLFVVIYSAAGISAAKKSDVFVLQQRLDAMDEVIAKHDAMSAKLSNIDAMEAKLKRFDEMAAKLEIFDEIEVKLKIIDKIEAKFKRYEEIEEKLKRFDDMEAKLKRFEEIDAKLTRFDELEAKIAINEMRLKEKDPIANTMKNGASPLEKKLSLLTKRVERFENVLSVVKEEHIISKIAKDEENDKTSHKSSRKRALTYEGDPVAFTAYLDHDLSSIGAHENLVFGHILLNDGNCYNMHTGAFTAPVSGVYHFDFFIGERDVNQIFVWLTVNNVNMVDAVVETSHLTQDLQGGNSANLKLVKGDVVFLKHNTGGGTHIEGSSTLRISSFSGFLLYASDSASIIG